MRTGPGCFDHLMGMGVAGAIVPRRRVTLLLASRLQTEALETMLEGRAPSGPSLVELREPDLGRVNYAERVRGIVETIWRPVLQAIRRTPPGQLLERLNTAWAAAQKALGDEIQGEAARIFAERAEQKAAIVKEEAARIAADQGLPATVEWLEDRKGEAEFLRKRTGQDLASYADRKRRQAEGLERLKDDWSRLLGEDRWEPRGVAVRFLLLAAAVLVAGLLVWLFTLPLNSILGLVAATILLVLTGYTLRPILQHLRFAGALGRASGRLGTAYKALSLFGLDEMLKRQEAEYYVALRTHMSRLQEACRARIAEVEARVADLRAQTEVGRAALLQGLPTIRPLLRETAVEEWYGRARAQAPLGGWRRALARVAEEAPWTSMTRDAVEALAFLKEVRAETELCTIYPTREARMAFLRSLRDAAIGRAPGEAFVSLDFAASGGRAPQVHLLVELDDPDHSELAQEIQREWGDTAVGLSLVPASNPSEIMFLGVVYGFPLSGLREWEAVEASFDKVKATEGQSIYPVLFPPDGEGKP